MIKANFGGLFLQRPEGFMQPFFGLSNKATGLTQEEFMALQRLSTDRFNLTAGVGQFQYFFAPRSIGAVTFIDTDNGFEGGWDGAHNDPYEIYGPEEVTFKIGSADVVFNMYRTDNANPGLCKWQVRYEFPL